ncbi:hypothetical protein PR048_024735 [Dryococelus australis]|uniref:Uncharacterized protein n=1 Tax=Dryococelus australis TaxID=614101 RepID=A0ABQ9GPI2_9NEOP|nr:hypothetical protein PR048_024735 [Dryococelus australis]
MSRMYCTLVACRNRAARCLWSTGFLGNLPFSLPFHSGTSQYSLHFTLIGSQDLDTYTWTGVMSQAIDDAVSREVQKGGGGREVYEASVRPRVPRQAKKKLNCTRAKPGQIAKCQVNGDTTHIEQTSVSNSLLHTFRTPVPTPRFTREKTHRLPDASCSELYKHKHPGPNHRRISNSPSRRLTPRNSTHHDLAAPTFWLDHQLAAPVTCRRLRPWLAPWLPTHFSPHPTCSFAKCLPIGSRCAPRAEFPSSLLVYRRNFMSGVRDRSTCEGQSVKGGQGYKGLWARFHALAKLLTSNRGAARRPPFREDRRRLALRPLAAVSTTLHVHARLLRYSRFLLALPCSPVCPYEAPLTSSALRRAASSNATTDDGRQPVSRGELVLSAPLHLPAPLPAKPSP